MRRWTGIILVGLVGGLIGAAPAGDPLDAARDALVVLEWDKAASLFSAQMDVEQPGSERWAQATFGAAVAVGQGQPSTRDREQQALALYQQLLETAPTSKFAARARMNIGRIKELRDYVNDPIDLDGARAEYLKVIEQWPNDPIAGEATLRAAGTLVQAYDGPDYTKDRDPAALKKLEEEVRQGQHYTKVRQGAAMLEQWLKDHPKEPLAAVMWQYLGDTYFFPLHDYARSLASYDHVDRLGWVERGNHGPLLWRAARLSELVNNRESAVKYYTKVITETPTSGKAYEAQLALKRIGAPVPEISIFATRKTTQPAELNREAPELKREDATTRRNAEGQGHE